MGTRFIGKVLRKNVVRPLKNTVKFQKVNVTNEEKEEVVEVINTEKEAMLEADVPNDETTTKKENKRQKKNKKMIVEDKLTQMEVIAGTIDPNLNVKVEKADKGLYERTENSTILLTEDNKMLLND